MRPPESPDVLTGGEWQNVGGVLRWVADEPATVKDRTTIHEFIACPTCRAPINERCRTRDGKPRFAHPSRIIARRCPCGASIPNRRGQKWCAECKVAARREQQKRADVNRRHLKREYDRARRSSTGPVEFRMGSAADDAHPDDMTTSEVA